MTQRPNDGRTSQRTSLFAAAILESGAIRFPIRIRNISSTGALLQGDALPRAGTFVRLIRGGLTASGDIRWTQGGKAGLSFTDPVEVEAWLRSCASKAHQQGVDAMVTAIRSGVRGPGPAGEHQGSAASGDSLASPGDLGEIRRAIAAIAERLAADPAVLERHGGDIQQLDGIVSILTSLTQEPPAPGVR
jgi:hypothetical protein